MSLVSHDQTVYERSLLQSVVVLVEECTYRWLGEDASESLYNFKETKIKTTIEEEREELYERVEVRERRERERGAQELAH